MSLVIEENNSTEIVNVNAENIMQEVIEASSEKAVIVQFWAPWCGPCKQLAPVLEKVCAKFKNIKLTKINIDENQEIAAQMRVQSVPTVFGFLNGQPVDGFAGAQPETAVTQFIEKLSEAAPGQADRGCPAATRSHGPREFRAPSPLVSALPPRGARTAAQSGWQ